MNTSNYPNPFERVSDYSKESLEKITDKLSNDYQRKIYGYQRYGENVRYKIEESGAITESFFGIEQAVGAKKLTVYVEHNGKEINFSVPVYLPEVSKHNGGFPVIISMHPIAVKDYALSMGYALIIMNPTHIADDNSLRKGLFYELYPYNVKEESEQTGELMAWAWGASKILDALYLGAAGEFNINPDNSVITGVSRWGKAAAVAGAFDKRFKMTVPVCSGAGGLALFRYKSEGFTYDFSKVDGPADYKYTANEPLSCLQSVDERGWFNEAFLEFIDEDSLPVDQYDLPLLAMDEDRYYFIVASYMGEDWVNAPSMWLCYKIAKEIYRKFGLEDHIVCNMHKEGHAVIAEDMKYIIAYFEKMIYKNDTDIDLSKLDSSEFENEANYEPVFDKIVKKIGILQ